jgi:hypothetical protein
MSLTCAAPRSVASPRRGDGVAAVHGALALLLPASVEVSPPLQAAHAIWLMRRASVLTGLSGERDRGPFDPAVGQMFNHIAAKVFRALESAAVVALDPEERSALEHDARWLSENAEAELRRTGPRDFERVEEWCRIARALRDVVAASAAAFQTDSARRD